MKSKIFIFLVWGICFNIVASYHQYRQEVYPEWSNTQNYPPNPNPAYLRQPADINYGAPQSVVNYVQGPPEPDYRLDQDTDFPEQKRTPSIYAQHQQEINQKQQRQHVESQSDAIYAEQEPAPLTQVYPEPRRYLPLPDRRYESYGGGHQPANRQAPPPSENPVYDNYSPQASRQWPSHNSFQPVPPIPKETYPQQATYPHWQSGEYKVVPQQNPYYDGPFEEQNDYNDPGLYTSSAQAEPTSEESDNPVHEILVSKPKVKEYLAGSHKRYIKYVQPKNPIDHVNVNDDNLLGKSKHFKSSEIINNKDVRDKVRQQENPVAIRNKMSNPTSIPDNNNQNKYPSEPHKNWNFVHHPRPILLQETPAPVPVKNDHPKRYYNPRYEPIKTNNANINKGSTISSVAKPAANNNNDNHNYDPVPVFKPSHSQPHENHVVDQNTAPIRFPPVWIDNNNNKNPIEPQEHKIDVIFTASDTNDKGYEKKCNKKPTDYSTNEENNYPSRNKYSNTPIQFPNNNDDTAISAEYTNNPATYYVKDTDGPNASDESTVSASPCHLKHPPKSDEIDTRPTYTQPKPSDYDFFDKFDQIQALPQESNDDISSNVSQYPEDGDPSIDKINNHVAITESSILVQQDSDNRETEEADANNENTVFKTESNLTDTQDTNKNVSDNDDKQSIVDSAYKDNDNCSSTTADDIVTLSPVESASPLNADSPTDIYTTKTVDEVEAEQSEEVDLIEKAKPENEHGKNEDSVENDTEKYDEVYFFDVKLVDSYIEKTSRTYVTKSGTTVENIEEVVWEHKDDIIPSKITITKVIWNPGPGFVRQQKGKPGQIEGSDDPSCTS